MASGSSAVRAGRLRIFSSFIFGDDESQGRSRLDPFSLVTVLHLHTRFPVWPFC